MLRNFPSVHAKIANPIRTQARQARRIFRSWLNYPRFREEFLSLESGPPILVTGLHRSGTTWVGSMLATRGVWYLHEPFNPKYGLWHQYYTYAKAKSQLDQVDRTIRSLLQGQVRTIARNEGAEHHLMPLRLVKPPFKRILIKDPIASLLSQYLTEKYQMNSIVLFRHPAGFVGSLKKLEWTTCHLIQQFLENACLMGDWLWPYQRLMNTSKSGESIESKAVLYGCVYTVLWGFINESKDMIPLTFEDLCHSPLDRFRKLYQLLNLPYNSEVVQKHIKLCKSEKFGRDDYRAWDVTRNSHDMAYRWRDQLASHEIERIREIWQQFDVPKYKHDDEW